MTTIKLNRNQFQSFPYHLVDPSPWPILVSFSLLSLMLGAVMYMQGFPYGNYLLTLGFTITLFSMSLWFRDVTTEGRALSLNITQSILPNYINIISKSISQEEIEQALINFYKEKESKGVLNKDQFGYYLAGLLEGDGHLSLPALGNTTLNRILNPRIVFTSHIKNLGLYAYIQSELGGIGRFQISGNNALRYVIGDIKGIQLFINLIHGKLRTPKNIRLNEVIKFLNFKYSSKNYWIKLPESLLDTSDFKTNSWFTGFTEADGHFGIKIVESKPKSDTRKRSVSENISLKFRLDQRSFDIPNSSSMLPVMKSLASFLSCKLSTYTIDPKSNPREILSLSVTGIGKLEFIVSYFNKNPLLSLKGKDFKHWEIVYHMVVSKQHLTEMGKFKIRAIASEMRNNK